MGSETLVPYYPLERLVSAHSEAIAQAIQGVVESGLVINGPATKAFEVQFARKTESQFCVGVANGLDALRLLMLACGVGPGDEVIVPAYTFAATLLAVVQTGAIPVPVDVLPNSGLIDPEKIRGAISDKTVAILVVHLHGFLADMIEIQDIARASSLMVFEDAAQAHGGSAQGDRATIGQYSDAVAYSFYPTKNLGALGDAGCVTTNRQSVAEKVRQLANYGSHATKYSHEERGWNSRLDSIQAAVLTTFLGALDGWNDRRREFARLYLENLSDNPHFIPLHKGMTVQAGVWHHFVLLSPRRDQLRSFLAEQGIATEMHYPRPAYVLGAFRGISNMGPDAHGTFSVSDSLAQQTLSIPLHPWLRYDEIQRVISSLEMFGSR